MEFIVETFAVPDLIAVLLLALGPVTVVYLYIYFPALISPALAKFRGLIPSSALFLLILSGCVVSGSYFQGRASGLQPSLSLLLFAVDYFGAVFVFYMFVFIPTAYSFQVAFEQVGKIQRHHMGVETLWYQTEAWIVFAIVALPGVLISWTITRSSWLLGILFGQDTIVTDPSAVSLVSIAEGKDSFRFTVILDRLVNSIEKKTTIYVLLLFVSTLLAVIVRLIQISNHLKSTSAEEDEGEEELLPPLSG